MRSSVRLRAVSTSTARAIAARPRRAQRDEAAAVGQVEVEQTASKACTLQMCAASASVQALSTRLPAS